jgi:hypothetical protein
VAQRLRIAGWNGQAIFDPGSLLAIHRYSCGIPRVVNLICEHCLVSAFVDQQKIVTASVVEIVARDFDLIDSPVSGMALPQEPDSSSLSSSPSTGPLESEPPSQLEVPSVSRHQARVFEMGLSASSSDSRQREAPASLAIPEPASNAIFSASSAEQVASSPSAPLLSPREIPPDTTSTEKFDLVDALKTLANLADRLREPEKDVPKERKI